MNPDASLPRQPPASSLDGGPGDEAQGNGGKARQPAEANTVRGPGEAPLPGSAAGSTGAVPSVDLDGSDQGRMPIVIVVLAAITIWPLSVVAAGLGAVLVDGASDLDDPSQWAVVASLVGQWSVIMVGVLVACRVAGVSVRSGLGLQYRHIDLLGIPAGMALQWPVLPLLYLPLQAVWPDVFGPDKLSARSEGIVGERGGIAFFIIIAAVAVGAPIFEELFYRGLLQRQLSWPIGRILAWIVMSVVFAGVHFSAIELPGLLAAGLLFGSGLLWSRRIMFGVFAHVGFNSLAAVALVQAVM